MKIATTSPVPRWLWLELTKPGRAHDPWACESHPILGWDETGDPVFASPRDGRLIPITQLCEEVLDRLEPGFYAKVLGTYPGRHVIHRYGSEAAGTLRWRLAVAPESPPRLAGS